MISAHFLTEHPWFAALRNSSLTLISQWHIGRVKSITLISLVAFVFLELFHLFSSPLSSSSLTAFSPVVMDFSCSDYFCTLYGFHPSQSVTDVSLCQTGLVWNRTMSGRDGNKTNTITHPQVLTKNTWREQCVSIPIHLNGSFSHTRSN